MDLIYSISTALFLCVHVNVEKRSELYLKMSKSKMDCYIKDETTIALGVPPVLNLSKALANSIVVFFPTIISVLLIFKGLHFSTPPVVTRALKLQTP